LSGRGGVGGKGAGVVEFLSLSKGGCGWGARMGVTELRRLEKRWGRRGEGGAGGRRWMGRGEWGRGVERFRRGER